MFEHSKFYPIEYNAIMESLLPLKSVEDSKLGEKQNLLDIFDHCLSKEEAEKWSSSYRDLNLRYESQYVDIINEFFVKNKSKSIMEFDYKNMESSELINIIDGLDQKEKIDFLTLLKNQSFSLTLDFYMIEDIDILSIAIKMMTRELYTCISLYFVDLGVSISSGYDLSLPICFESEDRKRHIESVCSKHRLFIR